MTRRAPHWAASRDATEPPRSPGELEWQGSFMLESRLSAMPRTGLVIVITTARFLEENGRKSKEEEGLYA